MKKTLKKWTALALALLLVCTALPSAYAAQSENEIMPCLNVAINVTSIANLSSTGLLTVTNTYSANDSQITRVVVTTYVEKRSLLLFWSRVDLGTTNDEWVDYGVNGYFDKDHYVQLPSTGTYRVTATFDVYNGSTLLDSIEKVLTVDY